MMCDVVLRMVVGSLHYWYMLLSATASEKHYFRSASAQACSLAAEL
jgi:hypothetical protein